MCPCVVLVGSGENFCYFKGVISKCGSKSELNRTTGPNLMSQFPATGNYTHSLYSLIPYVIDTKKPPTYHSVAHNVFFNDTEGIYTNLMGWNHTVIQVSWESELDRNGWT